jgi:hypothetical protein
LKHFLQLWRNVFVGTGGGHYPFELIDFLNPCSKDENIFIANFFVDLNVSTIHRADDQPAIHDKLHV